MKSLIPFVFILLSISLNAQIEPSFQSIDSSDNLAGRLVRSVTQDSNGFMWFATNNGLSRFDGYLVKNFITEFKQFNDEYITFVGNGNDQSLLLGTWSGSLYRYQKGTFDKIWEPSENSNGVSPVKKILENDYGVWVATSNGLKLMPQLSKKAVNIDIGGFAKRRVSDIWDIEENQLLVISGNELFLYDGKEFKPFFANSKIKLSYLAKDEKGDFYGYGKGKLYKIDVEQKSSKSLKITLPDMKVTSLVQWKSSLWMGTIDHGLFQINVETNNVKQYRKNVNIEGTLADNTITTLYFDKTKNFWVGNFNNGVDYTSAIGNIHFNTVETHDIRTCTSSSAIYAFYRYSDNIIFGTSTGAYLYNPQTRECHYLQMQALGMDRLNNKEVWSINHYDNELFITIGSSVTKLDINKRALEKVFELKDVPYIYDLLKTEYGFVAGTSKGVFFIDEDWNIVNRSLKNKRVFKIITMKGKLFFLTNRALYILNDGEINEFFVSSEEDINDAYVDEDYIWLANKSNKILKLDANGVVNDKYEILKEEDALAIASIVVENKTILMGANKGVIQYELETGKTRYFNKNDGVSEKAFVRRAAYKDSTGYIYFGSRDGFNKVNSNHIIDNSIAPKVALTKLTRFN